jgi:uncharacterized membrane protein
MFFTFGLGVRNLIGALPLFTGLLYTLPLTTGAVFFAYDEVFGLESETFECLE